jgi:hypothetical protein
VVLIATGYALLVVASLLYLRSHSSLASSTDVEAYVTYAARLRQAGIAADLGNIRTYGYPAFLALLSLLVGPKSLVPAAGVLQALLYGWATFWTARKLHMRPRFARIVLCGLLLTPYVVSIVVDAVSEAPSLTCMVWLAGLILRLQSIGPLSDGRQRAKFIIYFALGTAAACFAVMIRPANVLLLAGWLCGAVSCLVLCGDDLRTRMRTTTAVLIATLVLAFLFWSPQYLYNAEWYGHPSIFPVCPIGSLQLTYGLVSLKYETMIAHGAASALYYPNPWFAGGLPASSVWLWYLLHPIDGAATVFGHVFAAFTIDHLFVYRYDSTGRPAVVPIIGWALTASGIVTIGVTVHANKWPTPSHAPLCICTALVTAGSILFCMGAAVETRMALFPLATFSIAGLYGFAETLRRPRAHPAAVLLFLLIVLAGTVGAIGLRSLETTSLQLSSRDFARLQFPCYHAHPEQ